MKQTIYKIEVLGSQCPSCQELQRRVVQAAEKLKLDVAILYNNDIQRIIDIGLQSAPVLLINDEVILKGQLLSVDELVTLLKDYKKEGCHCSGTGCSGNCHCH
ncbi:MAG: hypothetical protein PWQ35_247 [Patescibacteria group bacterium]|nr:hypothetical protein [Patescibacteria group bacterium]